MYTCGVTRKHCDLRHDAKGILFTILLKKERSGCVSVRPMIKHAVVWCVLFA